MGTRAFATHKISIELSHPTGPDGQRAQIRIIDAPSRLMIMQVEIPPEYFYKMLVGRVDSETLEGQVLVPDLYQRVGKQRYHWSRCIGYGVEEDQALAWAVDLQDRTGLDACDVTRRQGGWWATWELWSNDTDEETLAAVGAMIETNPLPEGAR